MTKFVLETPKSRVRPVCPNLPRSFFLSLSKWLSFRPPNQRTKRQSTIGARNLGRSSNIFSAKYRVCGEVKLLWQTTFNYMVWAPLCSSQEELSSVPNRPYGHKSNLGTPKISRSVECRRRAATLESRNVRHEHFCDEGAEVDSSTRRLHTRSP